MDENNFQLLDFQVEAVRQTLEAIGTYDGAKNPFTRGRGVPEGSEGLPKPYLHRIRAVTGAGKTPILAAIAAKLGDCIILWTTPRGAVIEQATGNLKEKYNSLLPGGCEVLTLNDARVGKNWTALTEAETGCTIVTMTVGAFNQKDDAVLTLHKGGDSSPWRQLGGERKRPLWVFYDEGHNATESQFQRLLELKPRGFILASASKLSDDLWILVPGEDKQAKEETLNNERTTKVDTARVVKAGLLKRRIEIFDLSTAEENVLKAAYNKRLHLESISGENIIACYIVDRDSGATGSAHGLDIWGKLVALGANPKHIAVHLTGAKKAAEIRAQTEPRYKSLIATYDEKVGPEELKLRGFKHLIWNLSLEEGWDEPWAYVGYFHGQQSSENKVTQRIGRLIRNPFKAENGLPELPGEPALETVYCYLNASEGVLNGVVDQLRREMETSGEDVVLIKEYKEDRPEQTVITKEHLSVPRLTISVNSEKLEKALYDQVFRTELADADYLAEGRETKHTLDIASSDLKTSERKLEENVPTSVGRIVRDCLEQRDWRLIRARGSVGAWIRNSFWEKPKLKRSVAYSSRAYFEIKKRCDSFIDDIDNLISIEGDDPDEKYSVDDFILINPDGGDTDAKRRHYKVHSFQNALHEKYNGLNELEVRVAMAIDKTGFSWVRNPDRKGYGIPLIKPSGSSSTFYPDFIVWKPGKKSEIVFVEAKGAHLLEESIKGKLKTLPSGMRLGFVSETKGSPQLTRLLNDRVKQEEGEMEELIALLLE